MTGFLAEAWRDAKRDGEQRLGGRQERNRDEPDFNESARSRLEQAAISESRNLLDIFVAASFVLKTDAHF
jgi:hypothetical protein